MAVNVGIVGLGTIGNYLIDRILDSSDFVLAAVFDIKEERYIELKNRLHCTPHLMKVKDFPQITDVFVECASPKAVEDVVLEAFKRQKIAIIASIGGLMDNPSLWEKIESMDGKLILPSGAIGGLDILKALEKSEIESVELITRKNPRSIPSVELPDDAEEFIVYNGSAREAIRQFPKNVNVAALLSLAGVGFDRTRVTLIADSRVKYNIHIIEIKSKCGNYKITCENFPFERNPATSKLAAQSIWASLKLINGKVTYGL